MHTLSSRWRSASLRSQLMVLTGLLLALSILVTSFVAISVLRTSLLNDIDRGLRDSVRPVSTVLVADMGGAQGVQVPHAGFLLDADVVNAGRHPDSEIFLDDVTVSRKHAAFVRDGDGFLVRDLGSLNGTYVGKDRVDEARLHAGQEVQIGKYRLTYHLFHGTA